MRDRDRVELSVRFWKAPVRGLSEMFESWVIGGRQGLPRPESFSVASPPPESIGHVDHGTSAFACTEPCNRIDWHAGFAVMRRVLIAQALQNGFLLLLVSVIQILGFWFRQS